MQITRLKLLGFKSFVEPGELIIRPGLTGVVGPNGCGKSNLLEGLRWVMGETSYKAMRGGAMEDVIFAGTQSRPARNSAEVTVEIDNKSRNAPAEFNDEETLEIVRVIERGHGSSYRVNGREARARDVKLLFEDAATGARSHALVRQGQIGEIVNAKPQARRRLLEDAAGIAGLHSRRHEAELRLNAAEDNLERIGDVIGQLDAQLTSLKRQQRQAEQYRQLSQQLREKTALALYLEWLAQGVAVKQAESDLEAIFGQVAALTGSETEALNERERLAEALPPLRLAEAQAAAALERLSAERDLIDLEEEQIEARRGELNTQHNEAQTDIARDEQLIEEACSMTGRLDEDISSRIADLERIGAECSALKGEVASQASTLQNREVEFEALQSEVAEFGARKVSLDHEKTRLLEQARQLKDQQTRLQADLDIIDHQNPEGAVAQTEGGSDLQITDLEDAISGLEAQLSKDESAQQSMREEVQSLKDKARDEALDLKALETEIAYIETLLAGQGGASHRPVLMEITTHTGYEKALWAALGDDLDVPIKAAAAPLEDGVNAFWQSLTEPPKSDGHETEVPIAPPLPDGVRPLSDFVSGPQPLVHSLGAVGVIEESDAARLQGLLHQGQKLVSVSGGLWRWDGFVSLPDGPSSTPRRLIERNRLPLLISERDKLLDQLASSNSKIDAATEVLTHLETGLQTRRANLASTQQALKEAYQIQRSLAEAQRQYIEKQAGLKEALEHSGRDIDLTQARLSEVEEELSEIEAKAQLIQNRDEAAGALSQLRSEAAALTLKYASLLNEEKLSRQRVEELGLEKERWARRSAEADRHIGELKSRLEKTSAELKELDKAPEKLTLKRNQLMDQLGGAEKLRAEASDELAIAETAAKSHEQALRQLQGKVMEARESKARIETRLEGARAGLISIVESARSNLNITPQDALVVAGIGGDEDLPPLPDVEADIIRLKASRERLGAVNLRAEDEIKALEDQFGGLVGERDDLMQAVSQLRQAVSQLNEEGRQRLLKAFDEVNGHFQKLFQTLFAGGEAALKLIDSDDPLEAGLEIVARPPGKKPQVLTLLSGGEKALTAMSLIFAVFLTNPSPICVLDEVDAPLDDSNVERFCGMLEEMAAQTQTRFLVITHHPMTMERMDRLFGVTMSERGVSQLVSVDLATAEAMRESA